MSFKKISKWLDPFTYLDFLLIKYIGEPKTILKKILYWVIYIVYAFLCAYVLYSLIGLMLGVNMPMAIVVSQSMEPNLYRGDIVVMKNINNLKVEKITVNEDVGQKDLKEFSEISYRINKYGLEEVESITIGEKTINIDDIKENDVVVYYSNVEHKDIVHRLVVYIKANDGEYVLTKGDNIKTNRLIDQDCDIVNGVPKNNCLNIYPTPINLVKGKIIGKIPYLGKLKLSLFGG